MSYANTNWQITAYIKTSPPSWRKLSISISRRDKDRKYQYSSKTWDNITINMIEIITKGHIWSFILIQWNFSCLGMRSIKSTFICNIFISKFFSESRLLLRGTHVLQLEIMLSHLIRLWNRIKMSPSSYSQFQNVTMTLGHIFWLVLSDFQHQ